MIASAASETSILTAAFVVSVLFVMFVTKGSRTENRRQYAA